MTLGGLGSVEVTIVADGLRTRATGGGAGELDLGAVPVLLRFAPRSVNVRRDDGQDPPYAS